MEITITNPKKALEEMKKRNVFNLKIENKYIYYIGGILSKLEGDKQYFPINGKWVAVED